MILLKQMLTFFFLASFVRKGPSPDDIAVIMYTSGSTGFGKGGLSNNKFKGLSSVKKFVTLPLNFFFLLFEQVFFFIVCTFSCLYTFHVTKLTSYFIGCERFMIMGVVTDYSSVDILRVNGPKIIVNYYVTS